MSDIVAITSNATITVPIYAPVVIAMLAYVGWKAADAIMEALAFIILFVFTALLLSFRALRRRWGW